MSPKKKLQRFSDLHGFPNVYENFDPMRPVITDIDGNIIEMRGRWRSHFGNEFPVILELACGRGEYTLALARRYPNSNFIGVDIKGARIWKGARQALDTGLSNAAFLRTRIEIIEHFFDSAEVDEIWITFPDPFLRKSKASRRLTSPPFLDRYRKLVKPGGIIHLKTDSTELYEYTLEVLHGDERAHIHYHHGNIYSGELFNPDLDIRTNYEHAHLSDGRRIKYVQFALDVY